MNLKSDYLGKYDNSLFNKESRLPHSLSRRQVWELRGFKSFQSAIWNFLHGMLKCLEVDRFPH